MQTQTQEFTASGTFTVPANVTSVWVTMIGGGAAGCGHGGSSTARGGGGSGEYCFRVPMFVTAASSVSVTIGAKGVGASNSVGTDGGDSSVGPFIAKGGKAAANIGSANGGLGGGPRGMVNTTYVPATERGGFSGGSCGGVGTGATGLPGGTGGESLGHFGGAGGVGTTSNGGGGGGAASPWGTGGTGGDNTLAGNSSTLANYGVGGGGCGGKSTALAGGNGSPGYVLLEWMA